MTNKLEDIFTPEEIANLSSVVTETNKPTTTIDELRIEIEPLAEALFDLKTEKKNIESEYESKLKDINSQVIEVEKRIRQLWEPFVRGTDKASLKFQNFELTSKEVRDIKIISKEDVIDWLLVSGYKDVMKWDINTNTAKKILREELENNGVVLDSVEYTTFTKLDVK